MVTSYSRRDAMRLTGATHSNFVAWGRRGLLRARVEETTGSGHHRKFGFPDLVEIRLAVLMHELHISTFHIGGMLEYLRFIASGGREISQAQRAVLDAAQNGSAVIGQPARKHLEAVQPAIDRNMRAWHAFIDPSTRSQVSFLGFVFEPLSAPEDIPDYLRPPAGAWYMSATLAGEEMRLSWESSAVLLLNVGQVIGELEAATGDCWPVERDGSGVVR